MVGQAVRLNKTDGLANRPSIPPEGHQGADLPPRRARNPLRQGPGEGRLLGPSRWLSPRKGKIDEATMTIGNLETDALCAESGRLSAQRARGLRRLERPWGLAAIGQVIG
jgi:hypothetical protein